MAENVEMENRRRILNWLSGSSNARYEELRIEAVENSGQWFLNSEKFTEWANGSKPTCLWCVGIRSIHLRPTTNSQTELGNQF